MYQLDLQLAKNLGIRFFLTRLFYFYDIFRQSHQLSALHRTKSLNVNKQATYSHQAHIAHSSNAPFLASDPRWLDEFRKDINLILVQIEQRFNRLVISHQPMLSISEQIKTINELIGFIKKYSSNMFIYSIIINC